jgi:fumarylacetoacetate (FAA) hydrolase
VGWAATGGLGADGLGACGGLATHRTAVTLRVVLSVVLVSVGGVSSAAGDTLVVARRSWVRAGKSSNRAAWANTTSAISHHKARRGIPVLGWPKIWPSGELRMKLATYKDGSRDGQLVVVSKDLSTAHYATGIAHTLQQALDDWNFIAPQLEDLYSTLNQGKARHAFAFDPALCMAPLPRAHQWVQGNAYASHLALTRGADADKDLTLQWGSSAAFLGATDAVVLPGDAPRADFSAGWAAITGDVAQGVATGDAIDGVRLLALVNAWLVPEAQQASAPWVAFSAVAVTPDELGEAWSRGRVHLTLQTRWNERKVGLCDAAVGMTHHMGALIAAVAAHRPVRAGTVVGTGPVSNPAAESGANRWPKGYHSVAEKRAMEMAMDGTVSTEWVAPGERVAVEAKGADGQSVWGTLEQGLPPTPEPQ